MNPVFLSPDRFNAILRLMGGVDHAVLEATIEALSKTVMAVAEDLRDLSKANNTLIKESKRFTRQRPFSLEAEDPLSELLQGAGNNFLSVIHAAISTIVSGTMLIRDTARNVLPGTIVDIGPSNGAIPTSFEEVQMLHYRMEMNRSTVEAFVNGVSAAETLPEQVLVLGRAVVQVFDKYREILLKRHSTQGIKIHGDPVATDIAMAIFENTDSNGEIRDGTHPDEVSAYSITKAKMLAETVRVGIIGDFIRDPDSLMKLIRMQLALLWDQAKSLSKSMSSTGDVLRKILGRTWDKPYTPADFNFGNALQDLEDLDPRNIVFREMTGLLSAEEVHALAYQNHTLAGIVTRLACDDPSESVIRYILERKAERRLFELDENSFFVCKIGSGNQFAGEAPGKLEVIPGIKPHVVLDEVVGSGFDEIRAFITHLKEGPKWHALFVATSPSKKADKNNVLLIGPQGCGKTEILRAVASDRSSVSIFAQASDFLTCWLGEAEKNPKRLFEAGLRIQREAKKPVNFLIDEIDSIFNTDVRSGNKGVDLTTEFQVLMDGVTTYPHLAVWGATNNPRRIPVPLLRRFAKVVIVGELDQVDRVKLLKQFTGTLPMTTEFPEQVWEDAAKKLNGAVGDVLRKVVDHLWREKMSLLIENHPEGARRLNDHLLLDGVFDIKQFDSKKRTFFKGLLSEYLSISPTDLLSSVDYLLDNVAIRTELATAKATYEGARGFLSGTHAH